MVPDDTALVAALVCVGCGRLIPRTGVTYAKFGRTERNRALRELRRRKLAATRHPH